MAHNVSVLGLSRAGFRIPDVVSTPGYVKLVSGVTAKIDVDKEKTQNLILGERDNFIRTVDKQTFTVTIASPGVFTATAHGLVNGDIVKFTTTGALPTGLTAGTKYYVIAAATNTFEVSTTYGGSAVNTTGSQSGTHTLQQVSANIIGLSRQGFRVKNSAGSYVKCKVGSVVQVDLTDYKTLRNLRRNKEMWAVSTSATSLTVRGLTSEQRGFFAPSVETITITGSNGANATNGKTVTVGSTKYTIKTNLTEVRATGTINGSASANVSDGDTITINDKTYRFKNTIAQINDIHIAGSGNTDTSLTNLVNAITAGGTAGTDYFTGTTGPTNVTASAVSSHNVTLTAAVGTGTAANSYALSETSSNLTVTAFSGGVNPVANEIHIGGSADGTMTNLASAINGTGGTAGTDYSSNTAVNTQFTASAVSSHIITLSYTAAGFDEVATVSTTETTYTVGTAASTIQKIYQGQTATVNPTYPPTYKQLRRHYKRWVEN